ncbi:MGMT family protein [Halalkalibacter lacteus]|uniref:MGMT family protein n=1 Tax=Halalkalibacter lacteus TaxID=3090663 RepID=UPI002FCC729F
MAGRLPEKVLDIIKHIPVGKVMMYGQIAKLAGSLRVARQFVRILHSMSRKYNLPWHRVVNTKGEIVIKDENKVLVQTISLENEGVKVINHKVDLRLYQQHPLN